MPRSLTENLRRRGALPALVAAVAVGLWLFAERFLQTVIWNTRSVATEIGAFGDIEVLNLWGTSGLASEIVPLAVGIFLSLWVLAPVAKELQLRFVITRGVLAAGIGSLLFLFTHGVIGAAVLVRGWATIDTIGSFGEGIRNVIVGAIADGASTFVSTLPLVVLAVVFEWLWLRDREPKHPVAGMLDEV